MFEKVRIRVLDDYFTSYSKRSPQGVYFGRLSSYKQEQQPLLVKYIEETRTNGVFIHTRIGNPDEKQLKYYEEICGPDFQLGPGFFYTALKKWLPRINSPKLEMISNLFYDLLIQLAREGKNEFILKNTYIKFMCWLYYKFEPVLQKQRTGNIPKILFEGTVNHYELKMFTILCKTGCDILLLEYDHDNGYQKIDPQSAHSDLIETGGADFPAGFSVKNILIQKAAVVNEPKQLSFKTDQTIKTNIWLTGDVWQAVLTKQEQRGSEPKTVYNLFAGIYGAEDVGSYYAELTKWRVKLDLMARTVVLAEEGIPKPTYDETSKVTRKRYQSAAALLNDMAAQITVPDRKMLPYCQNAFMKVMETEKTQPLQKVTNLAFILLCWLNRYGAQLFVKGWDAPLFLYYGEVAGKNERLFLTMLSMLPIDVLQINPEGRKKEMDGVPLFYGIEYPQQIQRKKFPSDSGNLRLGTVAYQAERELDTLLYQDTGLYRNRQFQKAIPVILRNTYEEIFILWPQESKFRPNFENFEDRVMVPVIFAKISGVERGLDEYWDKIKSLLTGDEILIKDFPYAGVSGNPFKEKAYQFINNGKIDIRKIKSSPQYPFAFIRQSMQDFMLDRLQSLIDSKIIVGTGSQGTENLIVATILNMDKRILRLIQNYDFTKKVPKVVAIHTKERICSQEDSILLAYLSMLGFDIVIFVPTGYVTVERFYQKELFTDYQIGDYKYDLQIPDLKASSRGFASKFFRRGR